MTAQEFSDFLKELRFAYELKMPEKDIMQHWYQRIKQVPGEALSWISDRILASNDRFPKRFDALVSTMFREWLAANPDKRAPTQICHECDQGYVTVMETEEHLYGNQLIPVAYACGACRAFVRGVKKLTKSQAKREGAILHEDTLTWPAGSLRAGERIDVDELADQVGTNWR